MRKPIITDKWECEIIKKEGLKMAKQGRVLQVGDDQYLVTYTEGEEKTLYKKYFETREEALAFYNS